MGVMTRLRLTFDICGLRPHTKNGALPAGSALFGMYYLLNVSVSLYWMQGAPSGTV